MNNTIQQKIPCFSARMLKDAVDKEIDRREHTGFFRDKTITPSLMKKVLGEEILDPFRSERFEQSDTGDIDELARYKVDNFQKPPSQISYENLIRRL